MDVSSDAKPAPLWPIISFKRYIMCSCSMMKSGEVTTPDVTSKHTASEGEKQALFKLHNYTSQSCDISLDSYVAPFDRMEPELWRRLVLARLFGEDEVNDVLKKISRDCEPSFLRPASTPGQAGARMVFYLYRCKMLQTLLLWLDVDRWVGEAGQCLEKHRPLPAKSADEILSVITAAATELQRYQQIMESLLDASQLFKCASPDTIDSLEAYNLPTMREELADLLLACLRSVCERHLDNNMPFLDGQLRTLLKLLLATHFPAAVKMDCFDLLRQITPDNSDILAELAEDVYQALAHAEGHEGRELLQYLLDHQRPVFDAVYGPSDKPQNIAVLLVTDALSGEGPANRAVLNLLKRNNLRFASGTPNGCYGKFRQDAEYDMTCVEGGGGKTLEKVYWMVQFGYPLETEFVGDVFSYGINHHLKLDQPSTLLERFIMGLGTAEMHRNRWGVVALELGPGDEEEESYFGNTEREKCAALRYLIAEGSPVPRQEVLGRLLENNALTTLFVVVYHLFRAGKRVVLPMITDLPLYYGRLDPSLFPKTALFIRQMILRFGDTSSCHGSFLRKLELIGGYGAAEEKITLTGLAVRAVHRSLRSDCRYPRLRPDNYKQLQRQPVSGEVSLPLCSTMVPPAMIPLSNLEDVMESFRAEIREVGATRFASVKGRFDVFADCF